MYTRKTTVEELETALKVVNKKYENNLTWNRSPEQTPNGIAFTLRTIESVGHFEGVRISTSGRRLPNACWHAHGYFFDALFRINPEATITSRGKKITNDYGNWEASNIGSQMLPMYFSEACLCGYDEEEAKEYKAELKNRFDTPFAYIS